jgi:hypothetical protein
MMRAIRNFWVSIGVILAAAILAFAGPAAAAPLGQAGTGTITGQVLSLNDVPLPNVHLAAFADGPSSPNRTRLGDVQSDAQGRYSIQVPAGTVWMEFLTQDIAGQSFWGYDNLPVNVAAGETVSGQDFRVAIRIVSEPPPAVQPPVGPAPGMPRTGAGPDLWLPLALLVAVSLLIGGVLSRKASHKA